MSPAVAHALTEVDPRLLGARIRAVRVAAGLTQSELGAEDASTTYVSRIETGRRRPGPVLLAAFAVRLGVSLDFLVMGDGSDDTRRLELALDHAELSLAGGEAATALAGARSVLADRHLDAIADGRARGAYVEASALDALGEAGAAAAFQRLIESRPGALLTARSATALTRILRERGDLGEAIAWGQAAMDRLRPDLLGSEDGVRLAVTLAAALFTSGRVADAAALCDEAIGEAERLNSPVARASAYWNASIVRSETGDLDEALVLARSALALLESTERIRDLGRLRVELGAMMLRTEPPRVGEALRQLQLADAELDWSAATPVDVARHHIVTARALALDGELDQARARAVQGVGVAADQVAAVEVEGLMLLGHLDSTRGDLDSARGWFERAVPALTALHPDRTTGQLWFEAGMLAEVIGLLDEARDAYRRAASLSGMTTPTPLGAARRTSV